MARERTRQLTTTPRSTASLDDVPLAIDRVVVSDATIVFTRSAQSRGEPHREASTSRRSRQPGRKLDVTVDARSGDQTFKLEAKTTIPNGPVDGMTLPVDFKVEAPGMLPQALSGNGEVKLSGTTVTINSLTGMLGTARFSGYASIEGDDQAAGQGQSRFQAARHRRAAAVASKPCEPQGWSDEAIKLDGLNYVDADFQISAAALMSAR